MGYCKGVKTMLLREAKEILKNRGYSILKEDKITTVDLWDMITVNAEDYTSNMFSRIVLLKKKIDEWLENPTREENVSSMIDTLKRTVNTRRDRKYVWDIRSFEIEKELGVDELKKELYAKSVKCRKEYDEKEKEAIAELADEFGMIVKGKRLYYDNDFLIDNTIIYFEPNFKVKQNSEFDWEPELVSLRTGGFFESSNSTIGTDENKIKVPCWDIPESDPNYHKSYWKNWQVVPTKETVDDIYDWIMDNIDVVKEDAIRNKNSQEGYLEDQRNYYKEHPNGNWSGD